MNRLCYEDEKKKEMNMQALIQEHYSHDKVTGQKLFKPLINEGREPYSKVTGVTTTNTTSGDMAVDKKGSSSQARLRVLRKAQTGDGGGRGEERPTANR